MHVTLAGARVDDRWHDPADAAENFRRIQCTSTNVRSKRGSRRRESENFFAVVDCTFGFNAAKYIAMPANSSSEDSIFIRYVAGEHNIEADHFSSRLTKFIQKASVDCSRKR